MDSAPIMNKGGSKKTLFTCFKPVDDSFKRRKCNAIPDPVLAYLSDANEDGVVFSEEDDDKEERRNHARRKRKDTWRTIRTAMIKTPLMRKILKRWRTKKEPLRRPIEANGAKPKPTRRFISNASSTNDGSSSISTSPSCSSLIDQASGYSSHESKSPSSNGMVGVSMKNSGEDRRKGIRRSKTALCILMITSLLVLILWGKFLAILCTSIWFYLVPLSRRSPCNQGVSCEDS